MALERKVLMPDGTVLGWHSIASIVHYEGGVTRLEVESSLDGQHAAPTPGQVKYTSVDLEQDTSLTFHRAYEVLAADDRFQEYTDPAQAALDEVLPILTDEQAEQVVDAFPAWKPNTAYKVGDRRRHGGRLYRCEQAHISQADWTPDLVPALWTPIGEPGTVPEWVQPTGAQDAYGLGDHVMHNGEEWVSTYDGANVWEPGVFGWDKV